MERPWTSKTHTLGENIGNLPMDYLKSSLRIGFMKGFVVRCSMSGMITIGHGEVTGENRRNNV
jgi:hypothetical protein